MRFTHKQVSDTVAMIYDGTELVARAVLVAKLVDGLWEAKTDGRPFGVVSSGYHAAKTLDELCKGINDFEAQRGQMRVMTVV